MNRDPDWAHARPASALKGTRIRAIRGADLPFLYELSTTFETLHLWDEGWLETHPTRFEQVFLEKAANRTYFIICEGKPDETVGLACFYSHDAVNQWAYYTIALLPSAVGQGVGRRASALAIDWAFFTWSLNKLYLEILAENAGAVTLASQFGFQREARFAEHRRIDGRWMDVDVFSLKGALWRERLGAEVWARARGRN